MRGGGCVEEEDAAVHRVQWRFHNGLPDVYIGMRSSKVRGWRMRDTFDAGRMNPAPLMSPLSAALTTYPDEPGQPRMLRLTTERCAWIARHPTRQTPE